MVMITRARAFANNEVAFLAWAIDGESIPGCLGFHIVREYLDATDQVTEERPLASYVAFKGQRNPGLAGTEYHCLAGTEVQLARPDAAQEARPGRAPPGQ